MAMRKFTRTHDFLVCIDADAVVFPAMRQEASMREARGTLQSFLKVTDLVVVTKMPAAEIKSQWNLWQLPRPTAFARAERSVRGNLFLRLLGMGYDTTHVLVIGADPQCLIEVQTVGALYCPVRMPEDAACWQRLTEEALPKLLHGCYAGSYQAARAAEQQSVFS